MKSLNQGDAYYFSSAGHVHGGNDWSYSGIKQVGDTITLDGRTYRKVIYGSGATYEYSDSTVLITYYRTENVICDFRWEIGDTTYIENEPWMVTDNDTALIFGEYQPYIRIMYLLTSGYKKIFKKFGVVEEYLNIGLAWNSTTVHGARINGVIYGSFPPTSIETEATMSESSLRIFPNPTNGPMNVSFISRYDSKYSLEVFDILGRRVGKVHQGFLSQGHNSIFWNGFVDNALLLPSGMYFVRIQISGETFLRSISLIH